MENRWWLENIYASPEQRRVTITEPRFIVGRSNLHHIVCRHRAVSRNHAELIILQDGTLHVKANESANGTYVNQVKIPTNTLYELHPSDEIGFGIHSQLPPAALATVPKLYRYIYIVKKEEPVIVIDDDDDPQPAVPAEPGRAAVPGGAAVVDAPAVPAAHAIPVAHELPGTPARNEEESTPINNSNCELTSQELLNVLESDNTNESTDSDKIVSDTNSVPEVNVELEISANVANGGTAISKRKHAVDRIQQPSTSFQHQNSNTSVDHVNGLAQPSTSYQNRDFIENIVHKQKHADRIQQPSTSFQHQNSNTSVDHVHGLVQPSTSYQNRDLVENVVQKRKHADDRIQQPSASFRHQNNNTSVDHVNGLAQPSTSYRNRDLIENIVHKKPNRCELAQPSTSYQNHDSVLNGNFVVSSNRTHLKTKESSVLFENHNPVKENNNVKIEPNDCIQNVPVCKYSIENDCIVIDDEDEDFPCSQLLQNDIPEDIPYTYDNEPKGINDSMFHTIKTEVEELDRVPDGVMLNPIVVDSDTESPDGNPEWYKSFVNELMETDGREMQQKADVPEQQDKDKVVENGTCSTNEKSSVTLNGDWKGKGKAKKKYVTPPIIQPHTEDKTKNRRKSDTASSGSPVKRKHEKENNGDCKKIKTTSFYAKNSKEPSKRSRSESSSKELHEMRRKKLKELAEKPQEQGTVNTNARSKAAAKVKVSDSRGKFLTENHAVPSTSRATRSTATIKQKNNSASTSRSTLKNHSLPKTDNKNTTVKHDDKGQKSKLSSDVTHNVLLHSKQNNNVLHNNVQRSVQQRTNGQYNTRHNGVTHNIVQNNIQYNNLQQNRVVSTPNYSLPAFCKDVEDILLQMLHWNPLWFEEKKASDSLGLPPINKTPFNRMAGSFSSYLEYSNTVIPLLMIELWYFLFKEVLPTNDSNSGTNLRGKLFKVEVEHETKLEKMTILNCFTYITKEQSDQISHVKQEDVVVLQGRFYKDGGAVAKPLLGYVIEVYKSVLHGNDFINPELAQAMDIVPYGLITFKIMIRSCRETIDLKRCMRMRIITSLVSSIRLFKSVKYLEKSDLCPHILKPTSNLYKLPRVANEQLFSQDQLNPVQKRAVLEASYMCMRKEPGIFLIQGPPGTGKTTVIINIIQQILFPNLKHKNSNEQKQCMLIVAPSNGAVDEIVLRLLNLKCSLDTPVVDDYRKEVKLVRLGPKNAINPAVEDYSLYEIAKRNIATELANSNDVSDVNRRELTELQFAINDLKKHKTHNTQELATASRDLERLVRRILGRSYHVNLKNEEERLLYNARIICTTLSSCVGGRMTKVFGSLTKKISCCIIDEATQSNEQESLIPLNLGINKLVLVGDPKQLPAVTLGKEAKDYGFGQSLFSRIMSHFQGRQDNPVRMLTTQYRMHPDICHYPNKEFYGSQLENASSVLYRNSPLNVLVPYRVFSFESDICNSQEYRNTSEVSCVIKLVDAIVLKVKNTCSFSIGIITPYNVQKNSISDELKKRFFKPNVSISVNTVDSFQGQEKDIIIMSCVRNHSNNFVKDEQRLNVAITRAKFALYIIGSANLFRTCKVLGKIRDDANRRHLLTTINLKTSAIKFTNLILR